ncbi:hypothetical protein F2Q68_00007460 [Brassica cretica]|uniref:Uncharacterized protein n=1 Tax=Brassica cretica TaxID=69181 RepID=A0A8S9KNI2_BRACR|nr:hypothetical protein F2Q68_00007460 [Brassica cretica]
MDRGREGPSVKQVMHSESQNRGSTAPSCTIKRKENKTKLATKLQNHMIIIYAGKIEMHDSLYMLSKELGQEATATDGKGRHRLWHHHAITNVLEKNKCDKIQSVPELYMIIIYAGKIEMHDSLYMLSKELGQEATATDGKGRHRLWHHHAITNVLEKNKGASYVRAIFLDLSDITRKMSFHSHAFAKMSYLRYLKIYSSQCPQECDRDIKLNFPEGLQLPLNEVRCLHWLKFPLKEVPQDFSPENLHYKKTAAY